MAATLSLNDLTAGFGMADDFNTPEKVALWASAHEAKCRAHWDEQRRWNQRADAANASRDAAILEIRKQLWKMAGVTSVISGLIVGVVMRFV